MNYRLFELINQWAGRADGIDDVMEFAATWLIYAVFAAAAALLAVALYRRRLRPVVEIGAALVLAFAAAMGLTHLSREPRPFQTHHVVELIAHDGGVSMPSDHATAAFAIAFAVGVFLHRGWGVALAIAALLIGLSRVWVGVHYPADILAAAIIAALAVLEVRVASVWAPGWRPPTSPSQPLPVGRPGSYDGSP